LLDLGKLTLVVSPHGIIPTANTDITLVSELRMHTPAFGQEQTLSDQPEVL
jgi:hypothetical protein